MITAPKLTVSDSLIKVPTNVLGKMDTHMQKDKIGPYLTPYTKVISKSNKDIRAKTTKLLEENTGQNFHETEFDNDLLTMTPKAQATMTTKPVDFTEINSGRGSRDSLHGMEL